MDFNIYSGLLDEHSSESVMLKKANVDKTNILTLKDSSPREDSDSDAPIPGLQLQSSLDLVFFSVSSKPLKLCV